MRARHHTLRSGANRINESEKHSGHGIGLSLAHRVSRAALPLIFIAMLLIIGRRYTVQQLDVEKIVRQQLIPQLEAQYKTKIEVGAVESDWLSRVIVHDIVIGRDLASPIGALAKIQTATVNLDLVGLALKRLTPLQAINAATLEKPQFYLFKDAKGHLNWQDLLPKTDITNQKWRGRLTVRDGRVWYEDHALKSASGKITLADMRGLNAEAVFNGDGPIQFAAAAKETYLGPQKSQAAKHHRQRRGRRTFRLGERRFIAAASADAAFGRLRVSQRRCHRAKRHYERKSDDFVG